jgi:hypothetical protein
MASDESSSLSIAIRVYPESAERNARPLKSWRRPDAMFVFDTETRIDATQRLMFGGYRFIQSGQCLEEALFHGNDLPGKDRRLLDKYVSREASKAERGTPQLKLLTLRQFLGRLFRAAYKGRCLVVAFNHPFDLSRIAHDFTNARKRYAGGFSLGIWPDPRTTDRELRYKFRPRIVIKHIDSKRALIGFTAREEPDVVDLIPEGSTTGKIQEDYVFHGHFLDLHTLAFALTDRNYSLETACAPDAFDVPHGKKTRDAAWHRHRKIYRLQPTRCSGDLGISHQATRRI